MNICHGRVKAKRRKGDFHSSQTIDDISNLVCHICDDFIITAKLGCLNKKCKFSSHLICLANLFLEPGQFLPVEGACPKCKNHLLWGDLIRQLNGCRDLWPISSDDDECSEDNNLLYINEDEYENEGEIYDDIYSDSCSEIKF